MDPELQAVLDNTTNIIVAPETCPLMAQSQQIVYLALQGKIRDYRQLNSAANALRANVQVVRHVQAIGGRNPGGHMPPPAGPGGGGPGDGGPGGGNILVQLQALLTTLSQELSVVKGEIQELKKLKGHKVPPSPKPKAGKK